MKDMFIVGGLQRLPGRDREPPARPRRHRPGRGRRRARRAHGRGRHGLRRAPRRHDPRPGRGHRLVPRAHGQLQGAPPGRRSSTRCPLNAAGKVLKFELRDRAAHQRRPPDRPSPPARARRSAVAPSLSARWRSAGTARPRRRWHHASATLEHFAVVTLRVDVERPAAGSCRPGSSPGRSPSPTGPSARSCRSWRSSSATSPSAPCRSSASPGALVDYRAYGSVDGEPGVFVFATSLDHAVVVLPRVLWRMPWRREPVRIDGTWGDDGPTRVRITTDGDGGLALDLTGRGVAIGDARRLRGRGRGARGAHPPDGRLVRRRRRPASLHRVARRPGAPGGDGRRGRASRRSRRSVSAGEPRRCTRRSWSSGRPSTSTPRRGGSGARDGPRRAVAASPRPHRVPLAGSRRSSSEVREVAKKPACPQCGASNAADARRCRLCATLLNIEIPETAYQPKGIPEHIERQMHRDWQGDPNATEQTVIPGGSFGSLPPIGPDGPVADRRPRTGCRGRSRRDAAPVRAGARRRADRTARLRLGAVRRCAGARRR